MNNAIRKATVNNCARCGSNHEVEFRPFTRFHIEPDESVFPYWGMCPVLYEPILMRIKTKEEEINEL